MEETIEVEFKNLLTEAEFLKLKAYYDISEELFFTQENYYFDTTRREVQKMGAALRIRLKSNANEITLKTPLEEGLLETTEPLSLQQADTFKADKKFPTSSTILTKLPFLKSVEDPLYLIASLKTRRAEKQLTKDVLLVLDESWYHGKHDFELELETSDFLEGKQFFIDFLTQHQIPTRKTENKILRAIKTQQNEMHRAQE
ncbi:CYTH domain-containing protein [Vagococcus elongatus]|uniref:CYTH domain-containing protein n=1 Tax=Vagococcus elongatus TaxID=180344 RepID=A0A430B4J5_9ENTE|nr:CYTH domain-containing protein [Vagococcus elongatus]RSU15132.1 hypothetical protein CBF29_02025 [Vagococcus elongatus]